jgi:hypothetical protein
MTRNKAKIIEFSRMAADIRQIADEVEAGKFIAVAFALCDDEGNSGHVCMIDGERGTPALIDAMVDEIKVALFESLDDKEEH